MKIMTEIKVKDIYSVIDQFAPFVFQEEWDNSGLQIGSLSASVERVMLTLDVTKEAVAQATKWDTNLIISHHPLIFRPLRCIDFSNEVIYQLIKSNINVISAHTSLDVVYGGVSYQLATDLEIENLEILSPKKESKYYKVSFFLPRGYEKSIVENIFDSGVGEYNFYKDCAFESFGEGRYKEKEGANPFIKAPSVFKEAKMEVIVREEKLFSLLKNLKNIHPYQEVAFDVFKESINPVNIGYGCVGNLPKSRKLSQLINHCKEKLGIGSVRYVGDLNKKVKKVALCGGSGGSFVSDAVKAEADVYITGDLKYHEVLENKDKIALIDIGHRASELPVLKKIEKILKSNFSALKLYHFVENKDFFSSY
ncbi:MAG: Nif3-like dinuclear metal center hexameric protein [bacterium]